MAVVVLACFVAAQLLNVGHHIHGGEVFAAQHGVVDVTDGGGGTEEESYRKQAPNSLWRTDHFEHLRVTVDGSALSLAFVCGPVFPLNPTKDACPEGDVIYHQTLTAPSPA